MKIFILTLVAISVGFSESYVPISERTPAHTVDTNKPEEPLAKFFNINAADLKVKCDQVPDDKDRMTNVGTNLQALSDAYESKSDLTDDAVTQLVKNVVKAALPCAQDDQVNQKVSYYMNHRF